MSAGDQIESVAIDPSIGLARVGPGIRLGLADKFLPARAGRPAQRPVPSGPGPDEVWVETGRTIPAKGSAGEAPKARMLLWDLDPTELR